MIVPLSHEVQGQIDRVAALRKVRDEGKNLRDTLDQLEKIKPELLVLVGIYKLIRSRLAASDVAKLEAQFRQVEQRIKGSFQNFATQRRQVTMLAPIFSSDVPALKQSLTESWKTYSTSQLTSSLELLRLVESLPELQVQVGEMQRLEETLLDLARRLPRSAEQLQKFDDTLASLVGRLAQLEGLSDEVIRFLQKVHKNEATLADLTPAALAWCQQEGRSSAFRIRFANSTRGSV